MRELEGYHGTFKSKVNSILKDGFRCDIRDDHWLGQGIYYYSDYDLAEWWAKTKSKSPKYRGEEPVIIKSTYHNSTIILDLDSQKGVDDSRRQITDILEDMKKKGLSITFDKDNPNKYRCFLMDVLKKSYGYGGIKKTFTKERPSYRNFKDCQYLEVFNHIDLDYNETQICITDNKYIESNECVYLEDLST